MYFLVPKKYSDVIYTEALFDDHFCSLSTIQQVGCNITKANIRLKSFKNTVNSPINPLRKLLQRQQWILFLSILMIIYNSMQFIGIIFKIYIIYFLSVIIILSIINVMIDPHNGMVMIQLLEMMSSNSSGEEGSSCGSQGNYMYVTLTNRYQGKILNIHSSM